MRFRPVAWLQYRFDEVFARGIWGKFALLLVFIALVVGLGMTAGLIGLFSTANAGVGGIPRDLDAGPLDALWWSFHHVLDPSFFTDNYGATWPVLAISLSVSIGGMVVFGALVGLIATTLEERLAVLRRGDSEVQERGHVLLLGWSAKAPELLALLAHRHRGMCIVVLAPVDLDTLRDELRQVDTGGARIILRNGLPSDPVDLRRVACAAARAVILLPSTGTGDAPASADGEVVRTLLVLASYPWSGARPRLVAEVENSRHALAARLAGGDVPVVATSELVSLLLFQCSRQRWISRFYDELLSPRGANLLVRPAPECIGLCFGDLIYAYPSAVIVGTSRLERDPSGRARYAHRLNPGRKEQLHKDEWLIFLTRSDERPQHLDRLRFTSSISLNHSLVPVGIAAGQVVVEPREGADHAAVITGRALPPPAQWRVLVLGWNDHLPALLAEYDTCQGAPAELVVISGHDPETAHGLLADRGVALARISTDFRRDDVLLPGHLAALRPLGFDAVVVLADCSQDGSDPDARTLMTLVLLRALLSGQKHRPRVVAEVLQARTGVTARELDIDDVVSGPHLVSRQLMQVSEQMMLSTIFDDLLSSGGMDVYLKPISRYVQLHTEVTFRDLLYSAHRLDETALGVRLSSPRPGWAAGLHLAPPKDAAWTLEADDLVVVIAQELYDIPPAP